VPDPVAHQRELLQEAIAGFLAALPPGSGELVRAQFEATDPSDYDAAALACLSAAEAVDASPIAAREGAVAMALLAQMGLLFSGLEADSLAPSLSTAWGMPRTLNAGDAMFALAQDTILDARSELTPANRLTAASLIDQGGRDLIDALHDAGGRESGSFGWRALLPAALALGALLGGADAGLRERFAELGRTWRVQPEEELARNLAGDPRRWLAT
jgi:hypothetical protein